MGKCEAGNGLSQLLCNSILLLVPELTILDSHHSHHVVFYRVIVILPGEIVLSLQTADVLPKLAPRLSGATVPVNYLMKQGQ